MLLGFITLSSVGAKAQTVLISPTGDGGFENGTTFAANGWTVSNTVIANYNAWFVGNGVVTGFPSNCAYVSNDAAGATHNYNVTQATTIHFYRDVTITAGENAVLQFDVIVNGETNWDLLQVSVAPTNITPIGSATHPGSGLAPIVAGATVVGNYQMLGTGPQTITVIIPSSAMGNCVSGSTFRLIFSWKSDAFAGTQPPAAVDNIQLVTAPISPSPALGTFTINNTQATTGSNFNSFTDAITWLNAVSSCGFNNPIVFNVSAGQLFNELPPAITASGTAANTITFQKSGVGANPIVRGIGGVGTADAVITVIGGDYFTFDGIDVEDDLANVTTNEQMEYGYLIRNANATDGASFNTIKNCRVALNITRVTAIGILVSSSTTGGGVTPTATSGANSNCLIDNVTVENCGLGGILITSSSTTFIGENNKVTNSTIGAPYSGIPNGSIGTGATIAYGIQFNNQGDFEISNNLVRNLVSTGTKRGIYALASQGHSLVYNNIVRGIHNSSPTGTNSQRGMELALSTSTTIPANSIKIYNNFISDITSAHTGTASTLRVLIGLLLGSGSTNSTYDVDFNSISIDGSASLNVSSVCLELGGTNPTNNIRNNILANYTAAQTGTPKHFCIRSTAVATLGSASSIVNYNDYYLASTTNGFVGLTNTTDRPTITDWSTAITTPSGIDANSFSADPEFVDINTDLHTFSANISGTGNMLGITWVTDDIDGDLRTNPLDIGADQFTPAAAIDMGAFALTAPTTPGCYTANEPVEVTIRNYSTQAIDFSANNVTVTLDVSGTITQQLVVTVNNNALNGGLPLAGGDDLVVPMGTINMSSTGSYVFNAYTDVVGDGGAINDTMATVTINVSAGTVSASKSDLCLGDEVTLTLTGASGTIQWQASTDGGITWAPITGANSSSLLDTPSDTSMYRVEICGTLYSDTVMVNVIESLAPVTVNDTICGEGIATLTASGSGTLNWYDDATAGALINTGTTYSPFVTSTTTYYVENSVGGGGVQNVGATNPSGTNFISQAAGWGLYFTANDDFTLSTVTVYPTGTGTITIHITDLANNILQSSAPVNISGTGSSTPVVVPVNLPITTGSYKIGMSSTGITNLDRISLGSTYPYNSPANTVSITAGANGGTSSTTAAYYWFYNWEILSGCTSPRTPVTAVVTPADSIFVSATSMAICEGDTTTLSVTSANLNYTYTWSPANSLNATTGTSVMANPSTNETYLVEAIDNNGCQTSEIISISVNAAPQVTVVATPSEICVGGSAQLTAGGSGSGYCIPTVGSPGATGDFIDGVQFAGISNLNTGDNPNDYFYYSNLTANVVADGVTNYPITLTPTTSWSQQFRVWIDFNQNGVFEPSESVFNTTVSGTVAVNGNIIIPNSAINGLTRMRVACKFSTQILATEACGHTGFGEYEDYNVFITGGQSPLNYSWTPTADLDDASISNPIATPSVTTTYQVTVTDGIGCSSVQSITVDVIQNPIAGIDGFTQACATETALNLNTVITVQDPSGTWSYNPNPSALNNNLLNISQIPVGTIQSEYVVTNQCSSDTAIATIEILTAPSAGSAVTGATACNGNAVFLTDYLTGIVNLGGTWTTTNANGQIIGNIFHPAGGQFGPVQFTYNVDNGICAPVSTTVTVNMVDCTNIDENDASNISLFPNPNNGQFFVLNGGNNMTVTVDVMDMQGKIVLSKQMNLNNGSRQEINVGAQSGMYLVRVTNNRSSKVHQMIIK